MSGSRCAASNFVVVDTSCRWGLFVDATVGASIVNITYVNGLTE